MLINNFNNLEQFLEFEPGTYYKFVALVRAKDFNSGNYTPVLNTNERGEIFVRQWFVDSKEALEKYELDMINLCTVTKARLYVTTDRKSTTKTILAMQDQLNGYVRQLISNPNAPVSIRKLSKFSASASQLAECSSGPKYWLIDIDGNGLDESIQYRVMVGLCDYFKHIFFPKKVIENPTPNGFHLLVRRNFDIVSHINDFLGGKDIKCSITGAPSKQAEELIIQSLPEYANNAREWIKKYRDNWTLKENALTLVYMNFDDTII